MTDPIQATPGGTAIPQSQTPETPLPTQGQPTETTPAPKYVTAEDLLRHDEELLRRVKQSDRDMSKKIEGELAGIRDMLTATGTQLTADQEAKLRDQVTDRIVKQEEAPASAAPAATDVPPEMKRGLQYMFSQGVEVPADSPEYLAHIKPILDRTFDENEFFAAVVLATNQFKTRQASTQATANLRVNSGASEAPGGIVAASAQDYWKQAYKPIIK